VDPPAGTDAGDQEAPRLVLTKRANKRRVRPGGKAAYAITVRNVSDVTARDVRVCDVLPAGLARLSSSPRGRFAGGRLCWTIERLGPGERATRRLVARVLSGAPRRLVNRAVATGAGARPASAVRGVRVQRAPERGGGVTG
jgi:uncharacterized repeat protein (TIGR01451 family)